MFTLALSCTCFSFEVFQKSLTTVLFPKDKKNLSLKYTYFINIASDLKTVAYSAISTYIIRQFKKKKKKENWFFFKVILKDDDLCDGEISALWMEFKVPVQI